MVALLRADRSARLEGYCRPDIAPCDNCFRRIYDLPPAGKVFFETETLPCMHGMLVRGHFYIRAGLIDIDGNKKGRVAPALSLRNDNAQRE